MIEAMAIGLPTICTDCPCGGARMVINDGVNGLLVPVGNKEVLVKMLYRIAENESLQKSLGLNGETIRNELSSDMIVKKWKILIERE